MKITRMRISAISMSEMGSLANAVDGNLLYFCAILV